MCGGRCLVALLGLDEGFARTRFRSRVLVLGVASLVFLGMLTPWVIRNHQVPGHYIVSSGAWQTLAMTNNDNGGADFTPEGLASMPQTSIEQPEIEREAVYRRFVTKWIAERPWRFVQLYLWRAIVFWSPSAKTLSGAQAAVG